MHHPGSCSTTWVANYERIRALSNAGSQENLSGEIVKTDLGSRIPPSSRARSDCVRARRHGPADRHAGTADRQARRDQDRPDAAAAHWQLPGFPGTRLPWLQGPCSGMPCGTSRRRHCRARNSTRRRLCDASITAISTASGPCWFLTLLTRLCRGASAFLAAGAGHLRRGDLVFVDASEDSAGVGKAVEITSVPSDGVVAASTRCGHGLTSRC